MAIAIALSLPGGSKLLPFLYDIASTITGKMSVDAPEDANCSQHSLVMKRRGLVPFLHNYPAWLSSRRCKAGAAGKAGQSDARDAMAPQPDDSHTQTGGQPAIDMPAGTGPGSPAGDVCSQTGKRHASGQEDEVLYETVAGYSVRGPASAVEQELQRIVQGLDDGLGALQQAPVRRVLAGAFGRMEQQQHEAFLRIRAVRLRLISATQHASSSKRFWVL